MSCVRCGIDRRDWTPGCRSCTSRHYKRAIRSGVPIVLARYRAEARAHVEAGVQERARRQRDGELASTGTWLPRGERGRWLKVAA